MSSSQQALIKYRNVFLEFKDFEFFLVLKFRPKIRESYFSDAEHKEI